VAGQHFISYSAIDGSEFALGLHDALLAGPTTIPVWLDRYGIKPGEEWDEQVADAISCCESFLFID
jgi:hypothetical protein